MILGDSYSLLCKSGRVLGLNLLEEVEILGLSLFILICLSFSIFGLYHSYWFGNYHRGKWIGTWHLKPGSFFHNCINESIFCTVFIRTEKIRCSILLLRPNSILMLTTNNLHRLFEWDRYSNFICKSIGEHVSVEHMLQFGLGPND